jgi:hypothetical protein
MSPFSAFSRNIVRDPCVATVHMSVVAALCFQVMHDTLADAETTCQLTLVVAEFVSRNSAAFGM